MTGHGDEGSLKSSGHVLHEACFAAAGWALEQNGQFLLISRHEYLNFIADGLVIGFVLDDEFLWFEGLCFH